MRVTHVITRLVIGGAQENTVATVLGLRSRGEFEPALISGSEAGPEGTLTPSLAAVPGLLQIEPSLKRAIHPVCDWLALRRLTRSFRLTKPGIVHTHSGKAGILGRLAAAKAGVPVIVHTIHGPSFGDFQGAAANFIFTAAERQAGRVTTHFISVADAMTRQYLAAGIGRPENYTRIYSGFDTGPFLGSRNDPALRAQLGLAPEDITVIVISRLFKLKGHDDLIAVAGGALAREPRLKFLLVGGGPWRGRLESSIRRRGLAGRFVFTGLVPPEQIPHYLGVSDMLVHLSRREGLPRAVPQAMAAGKPVVAYDCDGAGEVCRNDETGCLIRPGDLAELTRRMTQLAGDAALRERLGARGRELAVRLFSVDTMVSEISALYRRLAAAPRA